MATASFTPPPPLLRPTASMTTTTDDKTAPVPVTVQTERQSLGRCAQTAGSRTQNAQHSIKVNSIFNERAFGAAQNVQRSRQHRADSTERREKHTGTEVERAKRAAVAAAATPIDRQRRREATPRSNKRQRNEDKAGEQVAQAIAVRASDRAGGRANEGPDRRERRSQRYRLPVTGERRHRHRDGGNERGQRTNERTNERIKSKQSRAEQSRAERGSGIATRK